MATIRDTLATFADGQAACWIEYNSVSLLVTAAGATNNAPQPCWVQATDTDTGQAGSLTIQPGQSRSANTSGLNIVGAPAVSKQGVVGGVGFPIAVQGRYPA